LTAESEGCRVVAPLQAPALAVSPASGVSASDQLHLLVTEHLYGSELLSDLSPCLQAVKPAPFLWLHPQDVGRLKLEEGKPVRLCSSLGEWTLELRINGDISPGVAIVPRLRGTVVEMLVPGSETMLCRIEKA
jgi:NADH-quinone oxidoreductase subunit G